MIAIVMGERGVNRMREHLSSVQRLRKATGLTQQELANKTGINIRQIQKYEYGEYDSHSLRGSVD